VLPPGGFSTTLTSGLPNFSALHQPSRCTAPGQFTNTAQVTATSQVSGASVSDDDPAILVCHGTPAIDLQKEVSVDGGSTWVDADTETDAAVASVGAGAQYRFTVKNTGTQALDSLSLSDPSLGLTAVPVTGPLAADATAVVTAATTGFEALNQPTRCSAAGTFTNTATVNGTSTDTQTAVSDPDSAVVRCEEPVSPQKATCTVCEQLPCLLDPSVQNQQCGVGQDVCQTRIEDLAPGRYIARSCGVRAEALAAAANNDPICENVEGSLIPAGKSCNYVCDGVANPNCNLPPQLIPTDGRIFPPAP
jgi:hypothetical protein